MLRKLLLPALAFTLFAAEAATAQTAPATPAATRQAYRKARKAERVLSKREQQLAQAAARAQAANQAAAATTVAAGNTTWNGWSNEPLPFTPESAAPHRATGSSLSVAPGIPLNQIGHGVSTDYNGRPLKAAVASTTLSAQR